MGDFFVSAAIGIIKVVVYTYDVITYLPCYVFAQRRLKQANRIKVSLAALFFDPRQQGCTKLWAFLAAKNEIEKFPGSYCRKIPTENESLAEQSEAKKFDERNSLLERNNSCVMC